MAVLFPQGTQGGDHAQHQRVIVDDESQPTALGEVIEIGGKRLAGEQVVLGERVSRLGIHQGQGD